MVKANKELDPKLRDRVQVSVALPKLSRLQVSASQVAVTGAAGPELAITARHVSNVNVGEIDSTRLVLEATTGSRIVVAGSARMLEFSLSGASRGDARQLKVPTAKVNLAGASRMDLRPDRAISGKATGASKLAMWSKPKRMGVATRDDSTISYVR